MHRPAAPRHRPLPSLWSRPSGWAGLSRLALTAAALLAAATAQADPLLTPPASAGDSPAPPWQVVGLPKQTKPYTRFTVVTLDGQRVLKVETSSSYGNLLHPLAAGSTGNAHLLRWRWRLDDGLPEADLKSRGGDDAALKVCALFDLPVDAVPFVERQLFKLMRSRAEVPLPAATVCYVWDAHLPPGTVLDNAWTRRIRQIVLRGPEAGLHTWFSEQRDVVADFQHLYADELRGHLPPLVGVAVGADADNTHSHSLGHVGTLTLE